jgi:ComF family protein
MGGWLDAALDLLFPAVCPVCHARSDDRRHRPFCLACWRALPLLVEPGCRVCGRAFVGLPADYACDACRRTPPPFAYARAVAAYRDGMREAIHALKYGGRRAVAPPLAGLLAAAGPPLLPAATGAEAPFDAVVPVPLHPARLAERGFNQAELLAAPCARRWARPLLTRALVRVRATRPQTELDGAARRENVAGAFAVARPAEVAGRHLLLVDDVLTTGATASAAARALRRNGAASVGVLALARVPDGSPMR